MKQRLTHLLLAIATLAGPLLFPVTAHAAGGSISVVANKSTVAAGGSLVVAIYMNGGGNPINAVEAAIGFPSSKLQYIGVSYSGSAFGVQAPPTPGDGTVSVNVGTTSSISGSALVATVTFKGLVGSGNATISVLGSSHLVSANDNSDVPHTRGATTVNFGAVAATPSGSAPAAAPVVEAPKDTTAPTISEIKHKDLQPNGGTITWKTNEPSNSVVEYGLDTSYGLSASVAAVTASHEVVLNSTFLTPKTVFHYRVKSTDAAGNVQTSPDQTLPIPGIPVTIVVRAADGSPQPGAMVTLDNTTGITDENGSVTLPSGAGNKKIISSFNGVTLQKPVTIDKTAKKTLSYQLAMSSSPENRWMYSTAALALVVLILLAIDSVIFGSRLFAKMFRIKLRAPAFGHAHHARIEPLTLETPNEAPTPKPEPIAAPAPVTVPRYTTVRPHDLDIEADDEGGELDVAASANVPLSQLVNNIPPQSSRPVLPAPALEKLPLADERPVTQIAIKHFNDAEPTALDLPTRVDQIMLAAPVPVPKVAEVKEKPAAPKKVTRRVKKPVAKAVKSAKPKTAKKA